MYIQHTICVLYLNTLACKGEIIIIDITVLIFVPGINTIVVITRCSHLYLERIT